MCGGRTVIDNVVPDIVAASNRKLSERALNVIVLDDNDHVPVELLRNDSFEPMRQSVLEFSITS
jgi:hypothetical protein